jgi:tellurite resistance protein
MFDLAPETEIRADQAEAIARGLIAVAKADGHLHEREAALITDFYSATTERAVDITALEKAEPASGEYLAALLASQDLRRLFLKTAMLLAYVDGKYSNAESKLIGEYGVALGFGSDMPALEQEVKEFMLSQLTGIRNTEAVAEVAKELKVSE